MTATKHLPIKETQHSAKNGEYLWWGGIGGASWRRLLVMDTCVHVCIEMTESFLILEDKSLGSTRINSELNVRINAVGQQSFF